MTMLDSAIAYAEKGWMIFPCQPGMKIPYPGTRGVSDATDNANTIRSWWTRWPDANIALACGKGSGVYVIDIDVDEKKGVNGYESTTDIGDLSMVTLSQNTPRGGLHALFKCDGTPPSNRNNFKPGVDIRSDGYYIMLSPSVHPNGGIYEWVDENKPMAEFPESYKPTKKAAAMPWDKPAPKPKAVAHAPERDNIIERATAYLRQCPPAVQGMGGHDALMWAARAMVTGFELSDSDALSLLWSEFNPYCNPPWNSADPKDVKDFERKVREARRTPGQKPSGWLLEDDSGLHFDDSPELLDLGRSIARNLLKPSKPSKVPPLVAEEKEEPPSTWPDELLHPPGLVGEICDWINASAGCYQPILALGAALTACGALFGRKVKDESNGRTNMYAMGVAHSSAGKDHPSSCIERLFHAAGAAKMLGGQVTSDSAIELSLMEHMVKLYCWDEIGHIFANIKVAGGAGGNAHLRTIVPTLMQLYSSPHKLYVGKQRAEGEARRLDQPHTCIWGLTSPDVLYGSISKAELRDGWLGRVVTFISHDRPKYRMVKDSPPPEALISMVQAWFARNVPAPDGMGDLKAATTCHQIVVETTVEAYDVFEKFRDESYAAMLSNDKSGDDCQFLWGKALQNARRIALIVAVGRRWDGAEIEKSDAVYGCALIRCAIKGFAEAIKLNLSDSTWESEKQKLMKIITAAGRDGVGKSELTRRTQWIKDKKSRDSYLSDMQEAGMIIYGANPEHPESRTGWFWARRYAAELTHNMKIVTE